MLKILKILEIQRCSNVEDVKICCRGSDVDLLQRFRCSDIEDVKF
jgi:hypothetical protein